ncbi:hypothetical protein ASPZODRAFT_128129 [Penicilliopsis zonata CBS 506.65]|uniref:Ribosomal protein S11 n=1 Tax=Penicilliopsis zonata CBS 506.65 TaxID=1073090 RepID=A0A1L9SQY1_9EURO|nr:hypothetical protein ASPZODRAFT_128129 [Penicilliopsis zonata CBS 506.65]OJJ49635.1 hypothetical protein ASPZODRAFT_128129 [Penicilliopsis zonata CBS 506.65]
MNTQFAGVMAKAWPSVSRQCQLRTASLRLARPFSSPPSNSPPSAKEKSREVERLLVSSQQNESTKDTSPLSAITQLMQGRPSRSNRTISDDYARMAESLEAEMLKNPYADRVPPHRLHVYSHKHNTVVSLNKPTSETIMCMSCGHLGFRKGKRAGYDPAYQLTVHVFNQIQERGLIPEIQRLEVVYRGFGPGRDAFTKVLLGSEGRNIRPMVCQVADATRLKFGGTRSKRVRRL